ncbi:MAG TPA: metal-dependent hydrolase [Dehalococcoidia bacterium]
MLFFGHIAAGVALADAAGGDPGWAAAGAVLPDIVDKTGAWVLKVMPSGRWLAHGLPCFALAVAASRRALPAAAAKGFALGYASHLFGDLYAGGRVPIAAPFGRRPKREDEKLGLGWLAVNLAPEALGLAYLLRRPARELEVRR